ncbi:MAG TPA: BLUF domain-containing protein [Polyangia bacterium]|nr:BLUF domain-containing protein [Polyangia bacterium]
MAKKLYEVIYGSVETRYLTAIQLSDLLKLARAHNQSVDITGVLLHQKGVFVQVLEGDESIVGALHDRIARDKRHKNVAVFRRGPIQTRQFAAWSMGFLELDPSVLGRLGGWNPLLQKGAATSAPNAERLRTILAAYR